MEVKKAEFIKGIKGTDPILGEGRKVVAFVGRSNVGKSSLINSLVGRKNLAKSSSKPGKTREINFYLINDKFYFADLPGYGFAKMKAKTQEKLGKLLLWFLTVQDRKPDQVLVVVDSSTGLSEQDEMMIRLLQDYSYEFLVILNKSDKATQSQKAKINKAVSDMGLDGIWYSTKSGQGKEELESKLLYNK